MAYEIISKIILRDGLVFVEGADSGRRPLEFYQRVDGDLTEVWERGGMEGLFAAAAAMVHRGEAHLRAKSRLTRALRTALHAIGLEAFQALPEEEGAAALARLALEVLARRESGRQGESGEQPSEADHSPQP